MPKYRLQLVVLVLVLVSVHACSQDDSGPTLSDNASTGPQSAMQDFVEASRTFDAKRMARLMHPEALQKVRDTFDSAFSGENGNRARTELLPIFSVTTYEEFAALDNVEMFQRLNESVSRSDPDLVEMMADANYQIIGQAQKGDEVFVTYILEVTFEGQTVSQEVVQRLKEYEGNWRLMLPSTSAESMAMIEARY